MKPKCSSALTILSIVVTAVVAIVHPSSSAAQTSETGTIVGVLVDAENGETLIGANVLIEGTTIGSTTDLDGRYTVASVPTGLHDLVFSYIGYTSQIIRNVEVLAGETTRIDLALSPEAIGMGEVVVEARALRNNESVLLRDRQKALAVSDAISAETISRSGSGDAASAMTKVTGASVVGGRYVYIRGLGDRYSSTHLNGSELPSADPDKKAFQLDMFPASLLDNIVTTKTFTPDKPGNFSGGLVNVGTKTFPEDLNVQLSVSTTYNTQTSGDDYLTYSGSDTDWLGFDSGLREIPDVLKNPDVQIP
ncbi:MAG: carboxypeptidase-like regulatory domain-containing protein, partial [Rhodothermales bacterium]|nr:carboxypeptidase-like regulatory domain-containing protein [Rhodothermales bacterium]